jgi:hypothetical protein
MGRLPAMFGNKPITARQPWIMYGEIGLTTAQIGINFPDTTYLNNTDRPFEIHRFVPFISGRDVNNILLQPPADQDTLSSLVKAKITDLGKSAPMTKVSTRIRNMVKGQSERSWELADPYYLLKGEQLQIIADADTFPANSAIANLNNLLVQIGVQGFFISLGPPSEGR